MSLRRLLTIAAIFWSIAAVADAPAQSPTQQVTSLLHEFINSAGKGDPAIFDRFFADDVIYTRASGEVITKASIMESLRQPRGPEKSSYTAEDVSVRDYGDAIVVAFRLEGRTEANGTVELGHYRNTGTFVRRNGAWQAVAWQATKIAAAAKP